ncbi:MAG TPA: cation:proton antiporter [Bryobacteraceae bacterium]|nr:cation:proton antiporter [Bryobacteraceae bacterium]
MTDAVGIPLAMLVVFGSAKLMAELFESLHQPGIVGEILAGVLIGPSVLGWIAPNAVLGALADLGVMFLLFDVGLQVKSSDLLKVGRTALLVATLGVITPFAMGWAILYGWHAPIHECLFVAAAMVATSVGITADVLKRARLLDALSARIILAAAVIDDVLGLLVLAVVTSIAHGEINAGELGITAVVASGFTMIVVVWGSRAIQRVVPRVEARLRAGEAQFHVALILMFALSLLAVYAGVAAIIGAFLAGVALSESVSSRSRDLTHGVTELLTPFFLVGIGLELGLGAFAHGPMLLLTGAVLLAALISKWVGCGLGAVGLGWKTANRVGLGMIPRGEVGMVVAQLGLKMGVIPNEIYSVVVFMAVATTIFAPPLLKLAFRGVRPQVAV